MEIQHGGRPPSWICKNLVLNVTCITKIFFRICMSNFLRIGKADCELWYYIELQYGGWPPSVIINNTIFQVTQRTGRFVSFCMPTLVRIGQFVAELQHFTNQIWRSVAILHFR
jgi:hypothetical protein